MSKMPKKERVLCILIGICLCLAIWAAWMLCFAVFDSAQEITVKHSDRITRALNPVEIANGQ